jgi:hypothetical protein
MLRDKCSMFPIKEHTILLVKGQNSMIKLPNLIFLLNQLAVHSFIWMFLADRCKPEKPIVSE